MVYSQHKPTLRVLDIMQSLASASKNDFSASEIGALRSEISELRRENEELRRTVKEALERLSKI